jgi:hypothetical protein
MSLHVISESKIRPAARKTGISSRLEAATGFGLGQFAGNKLACVVPGGREYWPIIDRESNNFQQETTRDGWTARSR